MGTHALNTEQRLAVEHDDGPLMVLAGPGTGKTRVITHRISRLIHNGADPERIVALTFTVKAAEEMRARLATLVGAANADRVQAGTFHSWGRRALQRFADVLGISPMTMLADSAQRATAMEDAVRAAAARGGVRPGSFAEGLDAVASRCAAWIDRCRIQGLTPTSAREAGERWEDMIQAGGPSGDWDKTRLDAERERLRRFVEAVEVFEDLEAIRAARHLAEHDDAIVLPTKLLREHDGAGAILRDEARHVVVDEFQDVNPAQLGLLRALCPPGSRPDLCVVGDDDQAIYAFRGADEIAFARFASLWEGASEVRLTENHRSSPAILAAAGESISRAHRRQAPDKVLEARRELFGAAPPDDVLAVHLETDSDAGPVISAMIRAQRAREPGVALERMAVIARSHTDLDRIARSLEQDGVPVLRARQRRAFDNPAVQDLHAWLQLLAQPRSVFAAVRLMTRLPYAIDPQRVVEWRASVEDVTDDALEPLAAQHPGARRFTDDLRALRAHALSERIDRLAWQVLTQTGLAQAELLPEQEHATRSRDLSAALAFIADKAPRLAAPADVRAFLEHFERLDARDRTYTLADDAPESVDESAPGVRLLTAHGAKGLEYDTVFVPRVDPSHGFGSSRSDDTDDLPRAITDPDAIDSRDDSARRIDEERRLFYVACTRAERRLVLLAKQRKRPSGSTHFFQELAWPGSPTEHPGGPVRLVHAEEMIDDAGEAGVPIARNEPIDEHAVSLEEVHRLEREARRAAAVALEGAGEAKTAESLAEVHAGLTSAAARLAITGALARGEDPPAFLVEQAGDGFADRAKRRLRGLGGAAPTPPEPKPLSLSYSAIDAYLRCPRCYQLRYEFGLREADSDVQSVGIVVHNALHRFYSAWREADAEGLPKPGRALLLEIGDATLDAGVPAAARDDLRPQLIAQLERVWDNMHDERDHIVELERRSSFPFEVDGLTHSIVAVLDRIDQTPGGLWRIVDYKTGKAWDKLASPKADDLQLGIYALALPFALGLDDAQTIDPGTMGGVAEYWLLAEGVRGALAFDAMKLDRVRDKMTRAIRGISAGDFGPAPACTGPCRTIG